MFTIQFVRDDNLGYIETISQEKANAEYAELCSDPTVTEVTPLVLTIDIQFVSSPKVYTYFLDLTIEQLRVISTKRKKNPGAYATARLTTGDTVTVVAIKYREPKELKAKAKRLGFSFSDYKVLHGTFIK